MNEKELLRHKSALRKAEESILKLERTLTKRRNSALRRFPIIFLLLSTFGLVCTFYGFEKYIDSVPFLSENPYALLGTGIGILVLTGTLYKKL